MIVDSEGFRLNVGTVIIGGTGKVFFAQRRYQDAWQFPQGGMRKNETPLAAMYRELSEEVGLQSADVKLLAESANWYPYLLPKKYLRPHIKPMVIGQKQKWFLLKLVAPDSKINLDNVSEPEFRDWQWVDYWYPVKQVIYFKQDLYQHVLTEFASIAQQGN